MQTVSARIEEKLDEAIHVESPVTKARLPRELCV